MANCNIRQGGVYANANEFLAREVIMITPDGYVIYNDYAMNDGQPFGRACRCSLSTFMQWAARPLTPEENQVLRRDEGEARDADMTTMIVRAGIAAASDEMIRSEFYRRGLDRIPVPSQPSRPADGCGDPPGAKIDRAPSKRTVRSKQR